MKIPPPICVHPLYSFDSRIPVQTALIRPSCCLVICVYGMINVGSFLIGTYPVSVKQTSMLSFKSKLGRVTMISFIDMTYLEKRKFMVCTMLSFPKNASRMARTDSPWADSGIFSLDPSFSSDTEFWRSQMLGVVAIVAILILALDKVQIYF